MLVLLARIPPVWPTGFMARLRRLSTRAFASASAVSAVLPAGYPGSGFSSRRLRSRQW